MNFDAYQKLIEEDINVDTQMKKKITGQIGEDLAIFYIKQFENTRYDQVQLAENEYDMVKDILAFDGDHYDRIEIKTLTVIRKYNAFCIDQNQWYKLDSADRVFFINNPLSPSENVSIYEKIDKTYEVMKFNNRTVRMYDVSKQKKLHTFKIPQLSQLLFKLSTSKLKNTQF